MTSALITVSVHTEMQHFLKTLQLLELTGYDWNLRNALHNSSELFLCTYNKTDVHAVLFFTDY